MAFQAALATVAAFGLSAAKGAPLSTDGMGGVDVPSVAQLQEMHANDYILHARGGELTQVSVNKTLLPHDPQGGVQLVEAALAADGTVYVSRKSIICKSTDGGRTWTSHPRGSGPEGSNFRILSDGTFVGVSGSEGNTRPMEVWSSADEGRNWQKISEIDVSAQYGTYANRYMSGLSQLSDGTLLLPIDFRSDTVWTALLYSSSNGGMTWQGPARVSDWWAGAEGNIIETASGKLLATMRHQNIAYTYKNVFLADSEDKGQTWENVRQLTTVFGQTRGYAAALGDGTVVLVHDTRYGPGGPGSRAMISLDEGKTWEDEVYYLDYSSAPGSYNASVVLEDDLILTITGSIKPGGDPREPADMVAIRWQLPAAPIP